MAGVEWKGGKCKGGTQAKGALLHNDKKERLKREHNNPDIDLEKTPQNFSYRGLTYGQKCKRYDDQVASTKVKLQRTGKNTNVTMIGLVVYLPKGLQNEDQYDPETVRAWFKDVGDILDKRYGKDFIEMDVHVDEVHPYIDAKTKKWTWSLIHGHAAVIPTVTEDGERYLNGKKFASRTAINELNQAIHEMSMEKYHVPYMDGSGKKGNMSIGRCKHESAKLLMEREAEVAEQQRQNEAEKQALTERAERMDKLIQLGREASKEKASERVQESQKKERQLPDLSGIHF